MTRIGISLPPLQKTSLLERGIYIYRESNIFQYFGVYIYIWPHDMPIYKNICPYMDYIF